MVWLLLLLVFVGADDQCPLFLCGEDETNDCLTVTETEVILSPCPEPLVCPSFSMLSPHNITCVEPVTREPPTLKCRGMKEEGELCNENGDCGEWLYCGLTRELEYRCTPVVKVGKTCESTSMCRAGSVCHEELCIEYFSLPEGTPAENKIACQSARIEDGVCLPPSESILPIPVKCTSDQDCRATDDTYSECMCARNSLGDRYCSLHESDEPVKLFLESVHNEFVDSSGTLMMHMVYYPLFVEPEECYTEAAFEFLELQRMEEWEAYCAAAVLAPLLVLG